MRAIVAPEQSNAIWTGSDDKDAGVQIYDMVEQGFELQSFVGA